MHITERELWDLSNANEKSIIKQIQKNWDNCNRERRFIQKNYHISHVLEKKPTITKTNFQIHARCIRFAPKLSPLTAISEEQCGSRSAIDKWLSQSLCVVSSNVACVYVCGSAVGDADAAGLRRQLNWRSPPNGKWYNRYVRHEFRATPPHLYSIGLNAAMPVRSMPCRWWSSWWGNSGRLWGPTRRRPAVRWEGRFGGTREEIWIFRPFEMMAICTWSIHTENLHVTTGSSKISVFQAIRYKKFSV